jgi:hypothetical protein
MGKCVAPQPLFLLLHVGIFLVLVPAILAIVRLVGMLDPRELLTVALKNTPDWMRYMVYGFGAYAVVNFLIFLTKAPTESHGNSPAIVWRGFSGHWMAFYSAAFAMLYSAAHADNSPSVVDAQKSPSAHR